MPYNLNSAIAETITITEEKQVKSFIIDREVFVLTSGRESIQLFYRKGFDDGQGSITYSDKQEVLILEDQEVLAFFTANPSLHSTVKTASYNLLKDKLELGNGSIE